MDTFGTGRISDDEISELVAKNFDLRNLPAKNGGKFYQRLAAYGHLGRTDLVVPWENLDKVDALKQALTASASC